MNKRRRWRLKAIQILIEDIMTEETEALTNTPDNIEGSEFARARFKGNIEHLTAALEHVKEVT